MRFTKRSEFVFAGAMMRRVSLLLLFIILMFGILGGCNDSSGIPADTETTGGSSDPAVGSSQNDEQATITLPPGTSASDDTPFYYPNEFEINNLPAEQTLINSSKQDILGFFRGPGLTTCCIVDFGDFECTLWYGGGADIDIVADPDAPCFDVTKYEDLVNLKYWHVIQTDLKTSGYATARGIEIGVSKSDTLSTYAQLGGEIITAELRTMNVHSSFNCLQTSDEPHTFFYLDNSPAFSSSYAGSSEVIANGARALIILFDSNDHVSRIIVNNPTAG